MSGKKNVTKVTENEKVMTKYDRKMQKRKEEAEKAKKEERKGIIIGIALVAALAVFVLSFPVRSYLAVNGTYIKVGGEKITQVEFDMQYNISKNSYIDEMSYYFSMFGMTDLTSLESMSYDDNLTFGDYFQQLAVDSLVEMKGVKAQAEAAGFTYDVSADLEEVKAALEESAETAGITFDEYLKNVYGSLATWSRIKPYLEESIYTSEYFDQVMEDFMPEEEAITAEYEANKNTYDSVDYHMTIVNAELPATAPDGTVETDEEGNEIAYEPTEEEVAEAMKKAYQEAEELEDTIAEDGTEYTGIRYSAVNSYIVDFLFDESRKSGDTTIIEDEANTRYFVLSFDGRYRDESPTYDIRAIITTTTDARTILDQWHNGEATVESFEALVEEYDENGGASTGGLYTGVDASTMDASIETWLTEEGRAEGDATAVTAEDGTNYVVYYVGENAPVWSLEAESTLLEASLLAYTEEAKAGIEVEDPKKNLAYLYVEEESSEEVSSEEVSGEEASSEEAAGESIAE